MSSSNSDILQFIQSENENNQVVIWSKSFCPYCSETKKLFQSLSNNKESDPIQIKIHELDRESNGDAIQKALLQMTGQRTVPNVFVNNQHVGGNDNCQAANRSGNLRTLLLATATTTPTTSESS